MTDDAEVKELHPFALSFDATAGIQDFRPKAVMVDPKDDAAAHSEGQEKPTEAYTEAFDKEVQKSLTVPFMKEQDQDQLPLTETEPNPSTEPVTEPENPADDLPPLPPELTKPKISKPTPKSITTPSAH